MPAAHNERSQRRHWDELSALNAVKYFKEGMPCSLDDRGVRRCSHDSRNTPAKVDWTQIRTFAVTRWVWNSKSWVEMRRMRLVPMLILMLVMLHRCEPTVIVRVIAPARDDRRHELTAIPIAWPRNLPPMLLMLQACRVMPVSPLRIYRLQCTRLLGVLFWGHCC